MTKANSETSAPGTSKKLIDLADLDTGAASDAGAEIELMHPTNGAALGIFINVMGKHSQAFREHLKEQTNARIRKDQLAKKRGKDPENITAEQAEANAIDLLVLSTLGWRSETYKIEKGKKIVDTDTPVMNFRGQELAFNVPNCRIVYETLIWVREQVDAGIGDLENFIKA